MFNAAYMEPTGRPTGPYPGGLSQPAVNIRLAHGDPVHLANMLVVPVAKKRDVLGLEAPRLATVQQHRETPPWLQPPLEPLRDVPGAEYAIAKSTKSHGRLLESSVHVVMAREVAVEERAEVDGGLGEAERAPAVQHQVRGVTVAVLVDSRWAKHGLRLALLARRAHEHEKPEQL